MATPRRRLARESFFALLVAYLREGIVDTDDFCLNAAVPGKYPFSQGAWTFSLNGELWHIAMGEEGQAPISPGVTVEFFSDRATADRAGNMWNLGIRIRIRLPWDFNGESTAQEISQLVDKALYAAGGKLEIRDHASDPPAGTGRHIQWQTFSRGEWKPLVQTRQMTDLALEMEAQYRTPMVETTGDPCFQPDAFQQDAFQMEVFA